MLLTKLRVTLLKKKFYSHRLKKIYDKINKMGTVVAYYTNNDWTFDDTNTFNLHKSLTEADKTIFHCDISDVGWQEQILLWTTGLRKYIIKDGLKGTAWALKKQLLFKMAAYFLYVVYVYALFYSFRWFFNCVFVFLKFVFN